jgi:hypothetical protein
LSSQLGIDKLQLLLPVSEVVFRPDFPAIVEKPINAATGEYLRDRLLYEAADLQVTGAKAFYNTENFNLSILPHREGGSSLVLVHFSGGAYNNTNLEPMDEERSIFAARAVQTDLLEAGCDFDVMKAKITRLDIARNVKLSHPVACYAPAFSALNCRKRVDKMDFGGTGFLVGNKSWEIGFYDKGAEMHEKGIDLAACPENTLRPEVRYKKSLAVREATGVETLADLKQKWLGLKPSYVNSLTRDVFRPKMEAKTEATLDFYQEARFVLDGASQRKWQAFKGEVGLLLLVRDMGLEAAKNFATNQLVADPDSEAGIRQVKRQNAELDTADYALRMHHEAPSGTLVKELYRELKRATLDF